MCVLVSVVVLVVRDLYLLCFVLLVLCFFVLFGLCLFIIICLSVPM